MVARSLPADVKPLSWAATQLLASPRRPLTALLCPVRSPERSRSVLSGASAFRSLSVRCTASTRGTLRRRESPLHYGRPMRVA